MKNSNSKTGLLLSLILLISIYFTFSACEDPDVTPSTANFAINSGLINDKDTTGILVEIPFSVPAAKSGKIYLRLQSTALYANDFVSDKPLSQNVMELIVNKGDTKASFKITPVYNASRCGNRQLIFTMYLFDGPFIGGDNQSYQLSIIDSDASTISIAQNSGAVSENDSKGILLHINIEPALKVVTGIYVLVSDIESINRFSTIPTMHYDLMDGNYLVINIPANSTDVDIKIIPTNDSLKNGNYSVDFSLYEGDNRPCLKINSTSKYRLTIVDDD